MNAWIRRLKLDSVDPTKWLILAYVQIRFISIIRTGATEDWATLLCGFAALLFPRIFSVFLALTAFRLFQQMPDIRDHNLVTLIATLILLPSAIRYTFHSGSIPVPTRLIQILLVSVYFFAFFHKLNSDFLDVQQSCLARILEHYQTLFPFAEGHLSPIIIRVAIFGTLIIEGLVPLFLWSNRLQRHAWLLLILFHTLLSVGFLRFSSTMIFLIFILTQGQKPGRAAYSAAVLFLLASTAAYLSDFQLWKALQWISWATIPTFMLFFLFKRKDQSQFSWSTPIQLLKSGNLKEKTALFSLFVFLGGSGFAPYLGWKTVGVFSIYSNLEVFPGLANHALVPQLSSITEINLVRVSSFQIDIMQIEDGAFRSTINRLNKMKEFVVPLTELRRISDGLVARNVTEAWITIEASPLVHERVDLVKDKHYFGVNGYFVNKLIAYKPIKQGYQCGRLDLE